ncbi:hypothetical protein GZH53_19135 [Flavihumibacter sp. R14]|nr:hypothetical protein [Flavihumibacter soli]
MISIKYKQLFDLEIRHSFYLTGKCTDLQVVPTIACQALLNSHGLRFLPTETGGKIFAKVTTEAGKDFMKSPLTEGTRFTFLLRLKRPAFENYTILNVARSKKQRYYFSNLVSNLAADTSPLLLADTAAKVVTDSDLKTFESGTFSFSETSTAANLASELRFTDTGEALSQELSNHNDTFNFSYDLDRGSSGRARFFIGGVQRASIFVADSYEFAGTFGVVEIFYKSSLPATYQFQQSDNSVETKFYKMAFANRATKWRYIIVNKFSQSVTGVSVAKTNGTPITFTAQSGAPAGVFIMASGNLLPLKEEPVSGIKLSDQDDKVLIANLPNPSLNLVKQEGGDIFSDILVTI